MTTGAGSIREKARKQILSQGVRVAPNPSAQRPLRPSHQPIKVKHLREWAKYRRKVGDSYSSLVILEAVEDFSDESKLTPRELVKGKSEQEVKVLISACAFVLDLYRELEVLA
jgi:hypothetical protein